jgi:outer membrane protein TolC
LGTRYGEAWRDLDSLDHAEKVAGLSLKVPFGFKKERLTRRRAELAAETARHEVRRVEEAVRREVKDAELLLGLARRRGAAGRRLAELEAKKLAAGEADFRRGRVTTDLLVRFQQDLRRAQAALLRAETDEAAAAVELARSSGALLPALGLTGEPR